MLFSGRNYGYKFNKRDNIRIYRKYISISYLKNNNNVELKNLLKELELIEDKIRECEDENLLSNYKNILDDLINKIEGIINE